MIIKIYLTIGSYNVEGIGSVVDSKIVTLLQNGQVETKKTESYGPTKMYLLQVKSTVVFPKFCEDAQALN